MNRVEYVLQCGVASVPAPERLWSDLYQFRRYGEAIDAFRSDRFRQQEMPGTIFRVISRTIAETVLAEDTTGSSL